jgi:hypothetical protein
VSAEREATGSLMTALLAVQAEAPKIVKNAENPHFKSKFASLDDVMDTVGPILAKHGLVWLTLPGRVDGEPVLSYRLVHAATGEAVEGAMPLMLKTVDPQGQGSALTYARRYSIMAVLGLVTGDDDDGNLAQSAALRSPFGPPASAEVATSARKAVAWSLGDASVNSESVTRLLGEIEQRAGGYMPQIAALAIGHVAAAARDARAAALKGEVIDETPEEREEREHGERLVADAAADEAARIAAEEFGKAEGAS